MKLKCNSQIPIGKYGRMRRTYLQEHHKVLYNQMFLDGSLWPHLRETDENAFDLFQTIVELMAKEQGVSEQLKADDWWRWVQEMGNIRGAAEEFVLKEVVYA